MKPLSPPLLTALILPSLFLASCGPGETPPPSLPAPAPPAPVLFIRLDSLSAPGETREFPPAAAPSLEVFLAGEGEGAFRPWMVQPRAAGFHETGGRLLVSLNGLGVGELGAPGLTVTFSPFFRGRSLGSSFLYRDALICQLYRETIFNDPPPGGLPETPSPETAPPLAEFSPALGQFRGLPLPEGLVPQGPGWELVEMLPRGDRWFLAWKLAPADGGEVAFRYRRYDPESKTPEVLSAGEYRRAFVPQGISQAPEGLRELEEAWRRAAGGGTAILRVEGESPAEGGPVFYVSGLLEALERGEPVEEFSVRRREGDWFLLDSRSALLYRLPAGGPSLEVLPLPPLTAPSPQGGNFVYTGFIPWGEGFVLGWEEQRFPRVGRTGLLIWRP